MAYTLPEITIVGSPVRSPTIAADFFCDGFLWGWNNPEATPEPPAPLNEMLLSAYFEGATAGRNTRTNIDTGQRYDGPAIGPDIGGVPYEELEREWKEAWSEFHREEPHIEPPGLEFMP